MESFSTSCTVHVMDFLKLWNIGGKVLYIHGISRITHARFGFFINSLDSLLNSWLLHCVLLAVGKLIHYWITSCRPKNDFNNSDHGHWSWKVAINNSPANLLNWLSIVINIDTWWFVIFICSFTDYTYDKDFCFMMVTTGTGHIVAVTIGVTGLWWSVLMWKRGGHNLPSSKWFWVQNSLVIDFCQLTNTLSFFTMWTILTLATTTKPKIRRFIMWF